MDYFPKSAPCADIVYARTYSRHNGTRRETWPETRDRVLRGITQVGHMTPDEIALVRKALINHTCYPSGRWLWVGGTEWIRNSKNVHGAYNCTSVDVQSFDDIALLADLAMQGCGTGAVLEKKNLDQLPIIQRQLEVTVQGKPGDTPPAQRRSHTTVSTTDPAYGITIVVGDSREGWVDAYAALLNAATVRYSPNDGAAKVTVVLSHVRPLGERLAGFGGVANPVELPNLWGRVAKVLNGAHGRRLNFMEACLLIDEMAKVIVAGNIRRCLPEDALVHTSQGLVPIKDIQVGDMVQTPLGYRKVTNKFDQGIQDVYEVQCNHPVLPRATLNHRMAVVAADHPSEYTWKTVGELDPGDLLLYSTFTAYDCDRGASLNSRVCVVNSAKLDGSIQTYDIEVEEAHCFYCDGYLTHNSAGMKQGSHDDPGVPAAKANLWQQSPDGAWRIDPDRDALRMSNHTRVYHRKPTLEELTDAVRQQLYTGEGAIQYAPEAIARCNVDLILDRRGWFEAVESGRAREYLQQMASEIGYVFEPGELDHRLRRFGLNPCLAPGTMVFYREIGKEENLTGTVENLCRPIEIWDGKAWVITDGFRVTGENQPLLRIETECGNFMMVTPYHTMILSDGSRVLAKDIHPGFALMSSHPGMDDDDDAVAIGEPDPYPFLDYVKSVTPAGYSPKVYCCTVPGSHQFTLWNGIVVGNCGEIIGSNFDCNLAEVNLNMISPDNLEGQRDAFKSGAIQVCALLHQVFPQPKMQQSREWDPIVAVCPTGIFDFFVAAFGVRWLQWWESGRPSEWGGELPYMPLASGHGQAQELVDEAEFFRRSEAEYLRFWRSVVFEAVREYCDRHGLKTPTRCTSVQPSGSKSLLTNASPGWHPPKATRFIRRIGVRREEPVALAARDCGYNIIPGQSAKDEEGNLLNDIWDPRATEWLVEIPVAVPWADMPGADAVDISKFSALAQFDFYMQVQTYYTTFNTSATIELREDEVEPLAHAIWETIQNDGGYISAALLQRFDAGETFPRMPFEPIDKPKYKAMVAEVRRRAKTNDFAAALERYDRGLDLEAGPAPCDSGVCLMP